MQSPIGPNQPLEMESPIDVTRGAVQRSFIPAAEEWIVVGWTGVAAAPMEISGNIVSSPNSGIEVRVTMSFPMWGR